MCNVRLGKLTPEKNKMKKLFAIFVEAPIKSDAVNDNYDTDIVCLKLHKDGFELEEQAVWHATEESKLDNFYILPHYSK
jgi:hypothetical protein